MEVRSPGPETQGEIEVAFVIADLVGFTALTETHGAHFVARLIARFVEIARAALAPGARLVERVGDAVLIAAPDAGGAIRTALALREGVEREPLFPALRTGVHAGPVAVVAGAYFGTPLNLTARLAGHAAPGQILCTETIAGSAPDLRGVAFQRIGTVALKNIARPVQLLEVAPRPARGDDATVDPVCRMRVDPGSAAASIAHRGAVWHFCSPECVHLFLERTGSDPGVEAS